jgi:isocitrate dehydrogenase
MDRALGRRAEMDVIEKLGAFAKRVEKATMQTISEGIMTGDLAPMTRRTDVMVADSAGFLTAVAERVRNDT